MRASKIPIITIDGASGTGKGVVTQRIANQLGWQLLDSGVLYRVLAFAAQKHQISLENEALLEKTAEQLDVQFITTEIGNFPRILFEGVDVTEAIRTEEMGNAASKVGAYPAVRQALLSKQREFRKMPGLVTDGRDMGTVVFPDADVKIFLTASPEERALRRFNQLKEMGIHGNLTALVMGLRERDQRDQTRAVAPLKPAQDAIIIDTSHLSIDEVVAAVMGEVRKKGF